MKTNLGEYKYCILCLYSGDYVKLPNIEIFKYCDEFVRADANILEIADYIRKHTFPCMVKFKTEKAAQWFIRRRLSYNSTRTDYKKLLVMNKVFDANGLSNMSHKIEYEVVEVPNECS